MPNNSQDLANKAASKMGFQTATLLMQNNGVDIYVGNFTDGEIHYVGWPVYFLVKDGKIHACNPDESRKVREFVAKNQG